MKANPKILVLRFSALGDVAMCIPVLWSLKRQYPGCDITFVSRPFARDLVLPLEGVNFFPVDFNKEYKGFIGLIKLFIKLKDLNDWSFIADLHGVMRTKILAFLFRFKGVKTFAIDKGRDEKKALCRKNDKIFKPLQSSFERYQEVFETAGYFFNLSAFPGKNLYSWEEGYAHDALLMPGKKIGIAPFAKHPWKIWPEEKMRNLLAMLDKQGMQIFLFGGRGEEKEKLDQWSSELLNGHNLAGSLTMEKELRVMASLDVMLSMDSANMHLASLVETPVVSIWGATHPFAGFYGWGQNLEDAIQVELSCRPCSVFGNVECHRGDFACMNYISEEMVIERIQLVLNKGSINHHINNSFRVNP